MVMPRHNFERKFQNINRFCKRFTSLHTLHYKIILNKIKSSTIFFPRLVLIMDNTAETLVSFTLETRFEMLSEDTVDACKDRLLDTIGCIAAGYNHPIAASSRSFSKISDGPICNNLRRRCFSLADMAAFANSVGIRILDMNDSYRVKSGGHPSDIVGALFAGAEPRRQ